MSNYWIGTSGYTYDAWKGAFYPDGIEERDMLRFYGAAFHTVEINYTFTRIPNMRTLQGWAKDTPEGFAFSLKAPRRITHEMQLRDAGEELTSFCDIAKALKGKVGALLFQLPPFLRKDIPRLEDFLHQMPPEHRVALEFRNPTWFGDDVFDCLARFNVALCICDHNDRATPFVQTASFGYMRLRQPDYAEEDLGIWAERLAASASAWQDAYVYFKHEANARGPELARAFVRLIGGNARQDDVGSAPPA